MPLNIQALHERFATNDDCLRYLFEYRFVDARCPKCGRVNAYHRHPTKMCYTCTCGQHQIFPKKGTIFEDSPLPLTKWFYAIVLMWQSPDTVSAKELERRLDVAYPTAWRMAAKIRPILRGITERGKIRNIDTLVRLFIVPAASKISRRTGPVAHDGRVGRTVARTKRSLRPA